jgi:hypothetical protein
MARPKQIRVQRRGAYAQVFVDGEELLPHAISRDSVVVAVSPDEVPTVTLTLVADQVDVINTLHENSKEWSS